VTLFNKHLPVVVLIPGKITPAEFLDRRLVGIRPGALVRRRVFGLVRIEFQPVLEPVIGARWGCELFREARQVLPQFRPGLVEVKGQQRGSVRSIGLYRQTAI
jgi:hypothetical protein